jgi:hypothetical protein
MFDSGEHHAMVSVFEMIGIGNDEDSWSGISQYEYDEIPHIVGPDPAKYGIDLIWM